MAKKSSRAKPSKKPSRTPPKASKKKPSGAKKAPAPKPSAQRPPAPKPATAKPAAAAAPPKAAPPASVAPMPPLPVGPAGQRKRFELDKLRLASVKERRPAVRVEQFARIVPPVEGFRRFLDSLPDLSEAACLRTLVQRVLAARKAARPVLVTLGSSVVRGGITGILIDLMRRNVVTAVALDCAAALDDFEVALAGCAGVDATLGDEERVAVARESSEGFSRAASRARRLGLGLGRSAGEVILDMRAAHADSSVLAEAAKLSVPATIHVAIGADAGHTIAGIDGAALGESALRDFRAVCEVASRLDGGVWCGIDESPILASTADRALSTASNLGFPLASAVRARVGAVHGPCQAAVAGLEIRLPGPPTLLLPLLRQAVLAFS